MRSLYGVSAIVSSYKGILVIKWFYNINWTLEMNLLDSCNIGCIGEFDFFLLTSGELFLKIALFKSIIILNTG